MAKRRTNLLISLWKIKGLSIDRNKELITIIIGLMKSISIFPFTMRNNLQRRIYYYWHLLISPRQLPGIFNFQLSFPLTVLQSPVKICRCHSGWLRIQGTRDQGSGIWDLGWSGHYLLSAVRFAGRSSGLCGI